MTPLSEAEHKFLTEVLNDGYNSDLTTKWEKDFCGDMLRRLNEYQLDTHISDKQWNTVSRIETKVYQ